MTDVLSVIYYTLVFYTAFALLNSYYITITVNSQQQCEVQLQGIHALVPELQEVLCNRRMTSILI